LLLGDANHPPEPEIQEKHLPHELPQPSKGPFGTFGTSQGGRVFGVDGAPEPDGVELEERAGMAADSVPEPYLDAWARLQCQRPIGVGEAAWRQAIDDIGKFLEAWGSLAVESGWTPGDIFDVLRDGCSGLAWWLAGEAVRSLGPEHAVIKSGRAFDRLTRAEWVNPYRDRLTKKSQLLACLGQA